ncbi:type II toxin-antitoxin system Phd/YefM family antitoxin [Pseudoalteromonas piscicida]|uniref:Antitoxin n=1 Tax=Pseudoalteromonas piscicida TaxID=43662 RepID=A0AAD0W6B2_PSEO7|nr:type II toxin-antitoxin system Phd/YefM family antitoxin [Pseudoalteromonas piscicida]ASD69185.1 prevent-host-death protein [Pseudoalteromonas piscicida]AXQ99795.1 type II toxin-antitoxin system Phd/YefM family antitoxin [Pseudoalteromonas piscicida]AXR04446.1 type II toxin-antitoxin system Phd/YefM family antitoxin [Pseudoalteromonas piscicida]
MKLATISQMKANAANLPDELGFSPLFVTQNGKESLVVQTHEAYQHQQEKMAFMTLLLQSRKDIEAGKTAPLDDFLSSI